MQSALDTADRQFLARLNRLEPASVNDLCEAIGVTATAVRQRLSRLTSLGFVERETARAGRGRGRPHHQYRLSDQGHRQLGDDYAGLARLLWQEIQALDDPQLRRRMIDRLRQALVERYRRSTSTVTQQTGADEGPLAGVEDRLRQLGRALAREGFDVEVQRRQRGPDLLPVLREHCCPYHDLAQDDSSICELEQSVFEEVLGVPVALTQCCRDGHSCCEFEPAMSGSTSG